MLSRNLASGVLELSVKQRMWPVYDASLVVATVSSAGLHLVVLGSFAKCLLKAAREPGSEAVTKHPCRFVNIQAPAVLEKFFCRLHSDLPRISTNRDMVQFSKLLAH